MYEIVDANERLNELIVASNKQKIGERARSKESKQGERKKRKKEGKMR